MNICPECFGNAALRRRLVEIRPSVPSGGRCDFHPTRKGIPLDEVGRIVEPALRANYAIGEWRFDEHEGDDLYTVLNDTTGAEDDAVADALADWLTANDFYWPPDGGTPFFGLDQAYVPIHIDGWRHGALWRRFREAILFQQRFFNDAARQFLAEIFDGIQHQTDVDNKPAFHRVAPEQQATFYRARIVPDEADFAEIARSPAALMGPPPPHLRRAGRMNAAGIAVFYGAGERDTAVAELRPAVGSLVSVAAFRVRRLIHVLDLTRFSRAGRQLDIYAKNQLVRATQWAFMQSFASEISQPILPGDEHLEYVPAQVVAEYLTSQPVRWRGEEVRPDAIIFRSAQLEGGRNIAIMGDASAVRPAAPPTADRETKDGGGGVAGLLDFTSPSSGAATAGLEYVEGSLQLLRVGSATYGISERLPSPLPTADGPDDEPDY